VGQQWRATVSVTWRPVGPRCAFPRTEKLPGEEQLAALLAEQALLAQELPNDGGHQLAQGLVRGTCQALEELTMAHEVGPQPLGDGEDPVRVPDLPKNLVAQEGGGALGGT
jgi:hypothetical protein